MVSRESFGSVYPFLAKKSGAALLLPTINGYLGGRQSQSTELCQHYSGAAYMNLMLDWNILVVSASARRFGK